MTRKIFFMVLILVSCVAFIPPASARDFWVVPSSSAAYEDAYKDIGTQRYWDGEPKLRTTVADAYAACVSGRGDTIHVHGSTSETLTTAIDIEKNNVAIIGYGPGMATLSTSGNINAITVSADDVRIENIRIAAPGTDNAFAQLAIGDASQNETISDVVVKNCRISAGSASTSPLDVITLNYASEVLIDGVIIDGGLTDATYLPASLIDIQTAITNTAINGLKAWSFTSTGGIVDDAAASNLALNNCVIAVTGTTQPALLLDDEPTGTLNKVSIMGTTASTQSSFMQAGEVLETDERTNSKQGGYLLGQDS